MSEHGYSILAEFWGKVPRDFVDDGVDELLEILQRETEGPVVGGTESGVSLRFSLVYGPEPLLADVGTDAEKIARRAVQSIGLDLHLEALEVQTDAHLDRELATPNFPELVGLSEIGEMLGVSKQRVGQLREREDFPKPVAELRSGPVWSRPMLGHFLEGWQRRGGRRASWSVDIDEKALARGMALLSDRDRQLLTRARAGATARELAEEFGINPEATRQALRRAFEKVQRAGDDVARR